MAIWLGLWAGKLTRLGKIIIQRAPGHVGAAENDTPKFILPEVAPKYFFKYSLPFS